MADTGLDSIQTGRRPVWTGLFALSASVQTAVARRHKVFLTFCQVTDRHGPVDENLGGLVLGCRSGTFVD